MCDKQVGALRFLLNVLHQVDHLRLNRHIQRGNALVSDNQLGVHNQGAGNADALTLTAGKLVRIAGSVLRRKSDFLKHFADFLLALLPIGEAVVDVHAFADDVADLLARIQTRHRVLENHLHIRAEHTARVAVKRAGNHLAVEGDATVRRVVQADDAAPDGRLAGAGFADQPVGFARIDVEGHAVDGLDRIGAGDRKVLNKIFYFQ